MADLEGYVGLVEPPLRPSYFIFMRKPEENIARTRLNIPKLTQDYMRQVFTNMALSNRVRTGKKKRPFWLEFR